MAFYTAFWNPNEDPPSLKYNEFAWDRNEESFGETYRQRLANEITVEWGLDLFDTLQREDPQRFTAREEFIDIYGSELQHYLD